jgi:bifunctional non-homologous end joining protein LigD
VVICFVLLVLGMQGCSMKTKKMLSYKAKRDFSRTPEPSGAHEKKRATHTHARTTFVVQHHQASHEHYDLRLEVGGVLVSWAVPKKPSMRPLVKRLAIKTEDHPLEYASFEGTIPEGQYGAGHVQIWDKGSYENVQKTKNGRPVPMKRCISKGLVEIKISGTKLRGYYVLVKYRPEKNEWLLIKQHDEDGK